MSVPISVIIPCHNQTGLVNNAIQSAVNAGADTIWVFDDHSSNYLRSPNMSQLYSPFPFRAGVCLARNYLIDARQHEFILPLDADDQLYPDAIMRLYEAWQPGTWVYGNHTEVDEDGKVIREVEAPPPGMLHQKNLTYATMLFHKDDWQRAGGYDPDFSLGAEDYAFQVALTANGVRPVKLEGAPIYRRMIHPSSRSSIAVEHFPMLYNLMRRKWPTVFYNH